MVYSLKMHVMHERDELEKKIVKLTEFINSSDQFSKLPLMQKRFLRMQKLTMENYYAVLIARLDIWEDG